MKMGLQVACRLKSGPLRVYLDGEDVSMDCVAADDRYGYAVMLRRDAEGRPRIRHIQGCPNWGGAGRYIMHKPDEDGRLVAEQVITCAVGCGLDVELRTGVIDMMPWREPS